MIGKEKTVKETTETTETTKIIEWNQTEIGLIVNIKEAIETTAIITEITIITEIEVTMIKEETKENLQMLRIFTVQDKEKEMEVAAMEAETMVKRESSMKVMAILTTS